MVLIAEDDPAILSVISFILKQFGYGVVEAHDGDEAVDLFNKYRESISLLILDAMMPRRSGREVYSFVSECKPGIKVLFLSGYPQDVIEKKNLLPGGAVFLQKPVTPVDLLAAMRCLLDDKKNGMET